MSCQHRHDGAAFVLGALDPADRARFEAHLSGCGDCRAVVSNVTELPGVLAHAPVEELLFEAPTPPPDLLPALFARVAADRRRRRIRNALVTAAALVLAVGGTVATVQAMRPAEAVVVSAQAVTAEFEAVDGLDVWGTAELVQFPEGTQIRMDCSYGVTNESTYGDLPYRLVVTNRGGETDIAGSWHADKGVSEQVTLFTRWGPQAIVAMEIQDLDGRAILRWQE